MSDHVHGVYRYGDFVGEQAHERAVADVHCRIDSMVGSMDMDTRRVQGKNSQEGACFNATAWKTRGNSAHYAVEDVADINPNIVAA